MEIGDWLVALDGGTIGRAKSAVPLRHDLGPELLGDITEAYRSRGLKPAFRIADLAPLKAVRAELRRLGLAQYQATLVKTGAVERLAAVAVPSARLLETPDPAWKAVFLGEGFDPADGAHRVAALSRSPDAVYAAAGRGGRTEAVGVLTIGRGWAGVHGMRTVAGSRGLGFASAILATLGEAARRRGITRAYLQVEEANPARNLYRGAGLSPSWRYFYWR